MILRELDSTYFNQMNKIFSACQILVNINFLISFSLFLLVNLIYEVLDFIQKCTKIDADQLHNHKKNLISSK